VRHQRLSCTTTNIIVGRSTPNLLSRVDQTQTVDGFMLAKLCSCSDEGCGGCCTGRLYTSLAAARPGGLLSAVVSAYKRRRLDLVGCGLALPAPSHLACTCSDVWGNRSFPRLSPYLVIASRPSQRPRRETCVCLQKRLASKHLSAITSRYRRETALRGLVLAESVRLGLQGDDILQTYWL